MERKTPRRYAPQGHRIRSIRLEKHPLGEALLGAFPTSIDNRQQRQLREALLSAFPTRHNLEVMVRDQLDENLSAIVREDNIDNMVFWLIKWSMSKGKLGELVTGALKQNSQNPLLISFAEQFRVSDHPTLPPVPLVPPPEPPSLLTILTTLTLRILVIILTLALIVSAIRIDIPKGSLSTSQPSPTSSPTSGPCSVPLVRPSPDNKYIGVEQMGNELIGLSDGSTPFDLAPDRIDISNKCNAVSKLADNDLAHGEAFWNSAKNNDRHDAEAQIYVENKMVLKSGLLYVTYIVGSIFESDYLGGTRSILQGAFLAQHKYNLAHPTGPKIRLLIANSGSSYTYATQVARQIVKAAQADFHIVAVLGWSHSSNSVNVQAVLANANPPIPMVSATSSSDLLSNNAYFLRIVPTDTQQARMAAKYIQDTLIKQKVAVFYDPSNAYSSTLKQGFSGVFPAARQKSQEYEVEHPEKLPSLLQNFLRDHPDIDMIYFAGYVNGVQKILETLQNPVLSKYSHLPVMGGDALAVQTNYLHPDDPPGKDQLSFTSFAFYQQINPQAPQASNFLNEYRELFDPSNQHPSNIGISLPDSNAILGYDAMQVLLNGSERLFGNSQPGFDKKALWLALSDPHTVIQGLSGPIQFGTDHNPINKRLLILSVNASGKVQPASP